MYKFRDHLQDKKIQDGEAKFIKCEGGVLLRKRRGRRGAPKGLPVQDPQGCGDHAQPTSPGIERYLGGRPLSPQGGGQVKQVALSLSWSPDRAYQSGITSWKPGMANDMGGGISSSVGLSNPRKFRREPKHSECTQ